jgi:hypothetical protein
MPAAAAALLVIAAIGALVSTRNDDSGVDVATDPDPSAVVVDDEEVDRDDVDDTTATTAATTTTPSTTAVTDTTVAPPPADDEAPPPPASGTDPGSGPATTVPQCQNSTDPSCGPFHWSPQPNNQPATLTLSVPDRVVAGQPVSVTMTMSDDGPTGFGCYDLNSGSGGPQISGPCVVERCPDRYGAWTPPAPKRSEASQVVELTFDEPGTYVVRANVIADGCDNVNPYLSGASSEATVEVVAQ